MVFAGTDKFYFRSVCLMGHVSENKKMADERLAHYRLLELEEREKILLKRLRIW